MPCKIKSQLLCQLSYRGDPSGAQYHKRRVRCQGRYLRLGADCVLMAQSFETGDSEFPTVTDIERFVPLSDALRQGLGCSNPITRTLNLST